MRAGCPRKAGINGREANLAETGDIGFNHLNRAAELRRFIVGQLQFNNLLDAALRQYRRYANRDIIHTVLPSRMHEIASARWLPVKILRQISAMVPATPYSVQPFPA